MNTVKESLNYLKFVPLLQDLPKHPFWLLYDAEADVLYIDFHNPPIASDDMELTDDDVVIRYGENDEVVSLKFFMQAIGRMRRIKNRIIRQTEFCADTQNRIIFFFEIKSSI